MWGKKDCYRGKQRRLEGVSLLILTDFQLVLSKAITYRFAN